MGRHFHANGITVKKASQTVASAAGGATNRHEDTDNIALHFRCPAGVAL